MVKTNTDTAPPIRTGQKLEVLGKGGELLGIGTITAVDGESITCSLSKQPIPMSLVQRATSNSMWTAKMSGGIDAEIYTNTTFSTEQRKQARDRIKAVETQKMATTTIGFKRGTEANSKTKPAGTGNQRFVRRH